MLTSKIDICFFGSLLISGDSMAGSIHNDQLEELYRRGAHALRTPLSIVLLELGMIESDWARNLEGDLHAYSETLRRTFLYLQCKAGGMGERKEFDLDAVAKTVADKVREQATQSNIELELQLHCRLKRHGYPDLLAEGLYCVLENATHFTPHGGHIKISFGVDGQRIVVEDSGSGYPSDILSGDYAPFRTSSGDGFGVGIGLPLAATAAALNGGRLLLDIAASGGARTIFDFESE